METIQNHVPTIRLQRIELLNIKKDLSAFLLAAKTRIAVIDDMLANDTFAREHEEMQASIKIIAEIISKRFPSNSRRQEAAWTRHAFAFYARERGFPLNDIATLLKKKDHSTIISGLARYKDLIFVKDKLFLEIANEVKLLFDMYYPLQTGN